MVVCQSRTRVRQRPLLHQCCWLCQLRLLRARPVAVVLISHACALVSLFHTCTAELGEVHSNITPVDGLHVLIIDCEQRGTLEDLKMVR